MREKDFNEIGFYIKVDEELKRQFNIKCLENGTNMSTVVKDYMTEYISAKNS